MTGIETAALLGYAAAAAAVVGAYSAYQGGKATEAGFKAQAQADDYNAQVAATNAATARQQAGAREEAQRRQARQILGTQRAALAQAGIGLSGSAADVYGQSVANAEVDALNIRYEGDLEARGLLAGATLDTYSGQVARTNAKTAKRAGYLDTASALLSGGAKAYGTYKGA